MGRKKTDTKVKQVTHHNKTRKPTHHDSTPPSRVDYQATHDMQKKESQIQVGWVEGSQEQGTKKNGLGEAAVGSRLLGLRAGSGPGNVNWELGTGLRGWDPDCFTGYGELGELQAGTRTVSGETGDLGDKQRPAAAKTR